MISIFVAVAFLICVSSSEVPPRVGIDGKCPLVKFVDDFDSAKFLGKWFAVKETGKEIPCVNYKLDADDEKLHHFNAFVLPANVTFEFEKNNIYDFTDGLTVTFKANPYMDGGQLRIFATDYENYAGIFICKQTEDVHYQMISFWSRTRTMSDDALTLLNTELAKYEIIDSSFLKSVVQEGCDVAEVVPTETP